MSHGIGTSDKHKAVDAQNVPIEVRGEADRRALGTSDRDLAAAVLNLTEVLLEIRDMLRLMCS